MKEEICLLARFNSSIALVNLRMTEIKYFLLQRFLVSLARALVKNAKIIILDEATGEFLRLSLDMLADYYPPHLC